MGVVGVFIRTQEDPRARQDHSKKQGEKYLGTFPKIVGENRRPLNGGNNVSCHDIQTVI